MKNYIGVKIVKAEPMEKDGKAGYKVRYDMLFTHDCHGIAFRLVCFDCYEKLMAKGYDGQYYDEADECLDEDY